MLDSLYFLFIYPSSSFKIFLSLLPIYYLSLIKWMIATYAAYLAPPNSHNQSSWPNAARKDAKKNIVFFVSRKNSMTTSKRNPIKQTPGFVMPVKTFVPVKSVKVCR